MHILRFHPQSGPAFLIFVELEGDADHALERLAADVLQHSAKADQSGHKDVRCRDRWLLGHDSGAAHKECYNAHNRDANSLHNTPRRIFKRPRFDLRTRLRTGMCGFFRRNRMDWRGEPSHPENDDRFCSGSWTLSMCKCSTCANVRLGHTTHLCYPRLYGWQRGCKFSMIFTPPLRMCR